MLQPVTNFAKVSRNLLNFLPITCNKLRFYSLNKKMTSQSKWKAEKNKILALPLEEKRKMYNSVDYVTVANVETWDSYAKINNVESRKYSNDDVLEFQKIQINQDLNEALVKKVSIFKGDITKLEIDAIVNAANSRLKAGGGVDGAIHRAAGPLLQEECDTLGGCPTGDAKVTGGYNLPSKYVIHTVGPQNGSAPNLKSCYEKCLSYHKEYKLKSIAFPCISTGIYGFPNRLAAHIALSSARSFLESNEDVERLIFCTFMPIDVEIYEAVMQLYFPLHGTMSRPGNVH